MRSQMIKARCVLFGSGKLAAVSSRNEAEDASQAFFDEDEEFDSCSLRGLAKYLRAYILLLIATIESS